MTDEDNMDDDEDELFTGVGSTYQDLYATLIFFLTLFVLGDVVCRRMLRIVPPLVGYICAGVAMGPEGWDVVPLEEALVLLGNLGLVLLITRAGLEMDLGILKKIGARGIVMAVVGSILPISIGVLLAWSVLGQSNSTSIAIGCCFGPTSAGIAINVLGQCHGILEAPIGQLIVAAAIVDDILALLVLSQLRALTTPEGADVAAIVVPIVSAFAWLFIGGACALLVAPRIMQFLFDWSQTSVPSRVLRLFRLDKSIDNTHSGTTEKADFSLVLLLGLLFLLLPATFYTEASYLLGAFLAGLAFCQEPKLEQGFQKQFKRIIEWLMRIFFAATIGFQVPLSLFGDLTVISNGFLLSLSLVGKLAVGPLLTPKFDDSMKRWRGQHLRDCAVVGFSMAGEAEFAFVVAVFGVTQGLIPPNLYASVVLAILLSTILSPLCLRTVLAVFPYTVDDIDDDDDDNDETSRIPTTDSPDDQGHDDENNDPATPTYSKGDVVAHHQ